MLFKVEKKVAAALALGALFNGPLTVAQIATSVAKKAPLEFYSTLQMTVDSEGGTSIPDSNRGLLSNYFETHDDDQVAVGYPEYYRPLRALAETILRKEVTDGISCGETVLARYRQRTQDLQNFVAPLLDRLHVYYPKASITYQTNYSRYDYENPRKVEVSEAVKLELDSSKAGNPEWTEMSTYPDTEGAEETAESVTYLLTDANCGKRESDIEQLKTSLAAFINQTIEKIEAEQKSKTDREKNLNKQMDELNRLLKSIPSSEPNAPSSRVEKTAKANHQSQETLSNIAPAQLAE